jgi:hypothetical protein
MLGEASGVVGWAVGILGLGVPVVVSPAPVSHFSPGNWVDETKWVT